MAACRLLMPVSWGCYHYTGNRGIRCSDENSGLLELVAIAQPMRGEELHVGESSAVFSSGAWINQQLPQDAHANMDGWVDHWRSPGEPGSGNQRSGITLIHNPDGRLVLSAFRRGMEMLEIRGQTVHGEWDLLGGVPQIAHPHSLTIEDPTPVADGDGRLWLFFRIPGHTLMFYLNQTNTNGSEWGIDTKFPPTEVFLTAND